MKKAYSPEDIIKVARSLDVRAKTMSNDEINMVIDDGYAELCSVIQPFSNEEVIPLATFYLNGEEKVSFDVEEDVNAIYDAYLTEEGKDHYKYEQGIKKDRRPEVIYKDNRYNGRVHVVLSDTTIDTGTKQVYDNCIIKYYYTPTHTTKTVYMDAQTWIAFKSALGVSLYESVHDVERNGQKRAEMLRKAKGIVVELPEDYVDPLEGRIFSGLEH